MQTFANMTAIHFPTFYSVVACTVERAHGKIFTSHRIVNAMATPLDCLSVPVVGNFTCNTSKVVFSEMAFDYLIYLQEAVNLYRTYKPVPSRHSPIISRISDHPRVSAAYSKNPGSSMRKNRDVGTQTEPVTIVPSVETTS